MTLSRFSTIMTKIQTPMFQFRAIRILLPMHRRNRRQTMIGFLRFTVDAQKKGTAFRGPLLYSMSPVAPAFTRVTAGYQLR